VDDFSKDNMKEDNLLKIAMAQIAPVWLQKQETVDKIKSFIVEAGEQHG